MMEKIQAMQKNDIDAVVKMAQILYCEDNSEMLKNEFDAILASDKDIVFVAKNADEIIGFLQMALRFEYVEGAVAPPVGYMEGIYVSPAHRKQQVACRLTQAGEEWAKGKGCKQMASDTEIENPISQHFHQKIGFKEVSRIVTYIKDIN